LVDVLMMCVLKVTRTITGGQASYGFVMTNTKNVVFSLLGIILIS